METEYIDGVPLSAWLDDRFVATSVADDGLVNDPGIEIFLQLLSIVQYMHCCGWLHGDYRRRTC